MRFTFPPKKNLNESFLSNKVTKNIAKRYKLKLFYANLYADIFSESVKNLAVTSWFQPLFQQQAAGTKGFYILEHTELTGQRLRTLGALKIVIKILKSHKFS